MKFFIWANVGCILAIVGGFGYFIGYTTAKHRFKPKPQVILKNPFGRE